MGWFSVVTEREVSAARDVRSDFFRHPGQTVVKLRKQKGGRSGRLFGSVKRLR
jgi:hypothetical protein